MRPASCLASAMRARWRSGWRGQARCAAGGGRAVARPAAQVSATAQTLSQGTSEQAASVEETTASLEEMSASITQNAENSRQMEQMAVQGREGRATRAARRCSETVEAMRDDRREDLDHRGDRLPDEPAGAERGHRGGAGRRARARASRWWHRGAQAGRAQPGGGQGDRRAWPLSSVKVAERSGDAAGASWCRPSARPRELVQEVAAAIARAGRRASAQINRAMAQVDQVTQRNASAAEELSSTAEELAAQAETLQQLDLVLPGQRASSRGRRVTPWPAAADRQAADGRPAAGSSASLPLTHRAARGAPPPFPTRIASSNASRRSP